MSFQKTVKTKDGVEKNIIAGSQQELDEAVKAARGETQPTYPNINKPVKKGHDKVDVQDDLSVELKDGTGAHNSPRNAVKDSGAAEGEWKGDEEPDEKQVAPPANTGVSDESDLPPKAEENKRQRASKKK